MKGVDRQTFPALLEAVGPPNVDALDAGGVAEAEMDTEVVLREITAAAAHLLRLNDAARRASHTGADRVAIRFGTDERQRRPVMGGRAGHTEQIRQIVHVRDRHVHVTVVVEVGERRAASRLWRRHRLAEAFADIRETAVAEIPIDHLPLLVAGLGFELNYLRIHVPVGEEQVEPSVVVEIDPAGAPSEPSRVDADSRRKGAVLAEAVA